MGMNILHDRHSAGRNPDLSQVPVVYLLHGLETTAPAGRGIPAVERYAREKDAALVMRRFSEVFTRTWIEDCPISPLFTTNCRRFAGAFSGFSAKREKNYLMGLSMGGYGTLKCVLQTPERYAGAAAFSAVADIEEFVAVQTPAEKRELQAVFGQSLEIPADCNLLTLAEKADATQLPKLYMACGEQDALYAANVRLADKLTALGADIRFEHWTGIHNWEFWDAAVRKALDHLL